MSEPQTLTGRCACGALSYEVLASPMIVHCCHCRDRQRATGSAYVLNAIVEADRVHWRGETVEHRLPTPSGKGQIITRCAACGTAVFSAYMVRLGRLRYIRVGTLDAPELCPPDVQIFTASKQPWVPLHLEIPAFEGFYSFDEVWTPEALDRMNTALGGG